MFSFLCSKFPTFPIDPQSNHIGQSGLGMMYLNGLGVDKVWMLTEASEFFSTCSWLGWIFANAFANFCHHFIVWIFDIDELVLPSVLCEHFH